MRTTLSILFTVIGAFLANFVVGLDAEEKRAEIETVIEETQETKEIYSESVDSARLLFENFCFEDEDEVVSEICQPLEEELSGAESVLEITLPEEGLRESLDYLRMKNQEVIRKNTTLRIMQREVSDALEEKATESLEEESASLSKILERSKTLLSDSESEVDDHENREKLAAKISESEEVVEDSPSSLMNIRLLTEESERLTKELSILNSDVEKDVESKKERVEREQREAIEREMAEAELISERTHQEVVVNRGGGSTSYSSSTNSPQTSSQRTHYITSYSCADGVSNSQSCVDGTSIATIDYRGSGGPLWFGGHSTGAAGVMQNFQVGDIVVVSGAGAGTYKISSIGFIPKKSGQSPSILGGGPVFQTCQGNQMRVSYAQRV